MRQVSWPKTGLIALAFSCIAASAVADDYIVQQNQNGFDLPGVTLPQGQDEVRAADGTTCSSAVSGTGAYLDVGIIRGNRTSTSSNDFATYGRVVVPIGRKPKRLDCSELYKLEVERLRMELELMRMGVGGSSAEMTSSTDAGAPPMDAAAATAEAANAPAEAAPQEAAAAPAEMANVAAQPTPPVRKITVKRSNAKKKNWANEGWSDKSNR